MRNRSSIDLLLLSLLLALTGAGRGAESFSVKIRPSVAEGSRDPSPIFSVLLSPLPGAVEGWSLGVQTMDPSVARIASAEMGEDAVRCKGGAEPDFRRIDLIQDVWLDGVVQGVVVDFVGGWTIGPAPSFEALRITYDLLASPWTGAETRLEIVDTLGDPPVNTLCVVGGEIVRPAYRAGATLRVLAFPLSLEAAPEDGELAADTFDTETVRVRVRLLEDESPSVNEIGLLGWSYGLRHDCGVVVLDSAEAGSAVAMLDPDYVAFDLDPVTPEGICGVTAGVVLSLRSPMGALAVAEGEAVDLGRFTYRSAEILREEDGDLPITESIEFTGELGSPRIDCVFSTLDRPGEAVQPIETHGTIFTIKPISGPPFVRADANENGRMEIADPIFTLNYIFGAGYTPACMDSADADDSGRLDVADGIYLLNFLFGGGPAPPPPFPGCGPDRGISLGCRFYPCP